MDDSRIGARAAIGPVLEAAVKALASRQKVTQALVERVGQACDSAGVSEPAATGRFVRPPKEWPEYRDWLQAQQNELRERSLSANAAGQHELARWEGEGGAVAADQPDETVIIVEPEDWQTKVDEMVDSLRRHGFDGAADEIVRHLPPQPRLTQEDRAHEKLDLGGSAFSRKEGADEREAVAWLLKYLEEVQLELATEGGMAETESTGPAAEPTGADKHPPQPLAPLPVPEKQLTSWREILFALGRTNNSENKQAVDRLNEKFNGPIVKRGQGTQPFANERKLLEWWNGLEEVVQAQANRSRDAKETVKRTHAYGREGEVVPEISGSVKRRRRDRQP